MLHMSSSPNNMQVIDGCDQTNAIMVYGNCTLNLLVSMVSHLRKTWITNSWIGVDKAALVW